jgi:hypothetical protein
LRIFRKFSFFPLPLGCDSLPQKSPFIKGFSANRSKKFFMLHRQIRKNRKTMQHKKFVALDNRSLPLFFVTQAKE